LVGGMALALDLSAGERERFSLQPLLLTPIQPVELVVGKWATVALVNSIFVALTLIGFYLTLTYAPLPAIGVPFLFHAQEAMKFIVVLLPLALFFPALFFLIGLRGHSVRESQATTSVVLLLFSVIPMMQMLLPQKESQTISFYPVAGHYAMLTRILRGDALPAFDLAMIYIVPLALLLLVLFVATRVLSKGASYRP
jgi:sodium transport system permease protein